MDRTRRCQAVDYSDKLRSVRLRERTKQLLDLDGFMNDVTRRRQGETNGKRERDGQPYFGGRGTGDIIQHQRSNRPALIDRRHVYQ